MAAQVAAQQGGGISAQALPATFEHLRFLIGRTMGLHLLRSMIDLSQHGRKKTVQKTQRKRGKKSKATKSNGICWKKTERGEPVCSLYSFNGNFRSPLTASSAKAAAPSCPMPYKAQGTKARQRHRPPQGVGLGCPGSQSAWTGDEHASTQV